ncbi:MAG: TolC family protein [Calditerrivibrio sp.]|nr:TolC family protein [Calditerrivibrio sp.]
MKRLILLFFLVCGSSVFALTVDEAVEKALKHFPEISISKRNVDMQKLDVEIARGDFYPKLNFSSSYSISDQEGSPDSRSFNNEIKLGYNLFSGFSTVTQLDSTRLMLRSKELTLKSTNNLVIKNVKSAYYDALMNYKIFRYYDELYNTSLKTYEFTKAKYESGRSLRIDMLKSLTEVKKYETKKNDLKNQYLSSLTLLGYYTGEQYDEKTVLASDFPDINLLTLENYLQRLEQTNPELKNYQIRSDMALKQLEQSKATFYPSLDLFGTISHNYYKRGSVETNANTASLGISLTWNLFDGFKDKNSYKKQKLNYYNILDEKRKYLNEAKKDLVLAQNKVASSKEMVTYLIKLIEVAEENYRLTSEAYELGRATIMELLKAKDELVSAKIDLVNNLNAMTQMYLNIQYLTGAIE